MKKLKWYFALSLLTVGTAFAECETLPPYWCDDGTQADSLMDAVMHNQFQDAAVRTQQHRNLAEKKRQAIIQENSKWLTKAESRRYISVGESAAQRYQGCVVGVLMSSMLAPKPPQRGEKADAVCQQAAIENQQVVLYETLAYYRKEHKKKPLAQGPAVPSEGEATSAYEYRKRRFESDLKTLPAEEQRRLQELSSGMESNMKLCAENADALACNEMVSKPLAAAFNETFGKANYPLPR